MGTQDGFHRVLRLLAMRARFIAASRPVIQGALPLRGRRPQLTGDRGNASLSPTPAVIRPSFAGCSAANVSLRTQRVALALNRIALPLAVLMLGATAAAQQPAAQNLAPPAAKPAPAKPAPKPSAPKDAPQSAALGPQPVLLGQYGEWGTYAAQSGSGKVCFAVAKPSSSRTTPASRPRDPVFFFVASRPAENVRNEVSVVIGYSFKPATDASVEIGPAKFALYTQSDGAWIKNAAEEARLVDTMRKGTDLVVTGTSSHGTQSVDRYVLKGLSQALDRAAQECR
jgi:hypothetical protein